jgi:hypothetical protein
MQIALFLGAGFSKWSCDLPLVANLFDFAVHADNATEERRIARLEKIYSKWHAANPHHHPEVFVRHMAGPTSRFSLVNWYITRRLTEPFVVASGRRYTWYINSYYASQHSGILKARRLLGALSCLGKVSILTTNYDMVPEYALGTRGFNYGTIGEQIGFSPYPYPRPVLVTGDISISKLHGSISWDERNKYPDLRCGLTGKCLIVPPVTEKRPPKLLEQQWAIAKKSLAICDILLIFGFSFNENDQAIRKFVSMNLAPSANAILVNITDHRNRLRPILGSRTVSYADALDDGLCDTLSDLIVNANEMRKQA